MCPCHTPWVCTSDLLIVALELLGLVVAAGLAFPRAVEQSIGSRGGVLVEGVVPGRFALAAGAAGSVGSGECEVIVDKGHHSTGKVVGNELLAR